MVKRIFPGALLLLCAIVVFAQSQTTSDTNLNTGTTTSVTWTAPNGADQAVYVYQSSTPIWQLVTSPWNVTQGSGTLEMAYSGSGSITTTVNLTGVNTGQGVNGNPFIFYGADDGGDLLNGQPPQFPVQMNTLSAITHDSTYNLSCTNCGGDIDVLFNDGYILPTKTTDGGLNSVLNFEIIPYFNFSFGETCTFETTVTYPAVVNGTATNLSWDVTYCPGPGNSPIGGDVLFYPHTLPGMISGELSINELTFAEEAVSIAGSPASNSWWFAGIAQGTEFGDGATFNYTYTVTKLGVTIVPSLGGSSINGATNLTGKAQVNP